MRRHRRLAGNSMLELTITVMLIGILVRIGVPKYANSMKRYQFYAAAKRIAADIEYARQYARTKGTTQQIVFTLSSSSYSLTGMDNPQRTSQPYTVNLNTSDYQTTINAVNFGSSGNGATIIFDMFGRPDYAGSVTIRQGTTNKVITVNAAGKVTYP